VNTNLSLAEGMMPLVDTARRGPYIERRMPEPRVSTAN